MSSDLRKRKINTSQSVVPNGTTTINISKGDATIISSESKISLQDDDSTMKKNIETICFSKFKSLKDMVSEQEYLDMSNSIPLEDCEYVDAIISTTENDSHYTRLHMGYYFESGECRERFKDIIENQKHEDWDDFECEILASYWHYSRTDTFLVYDDCHKEFLEFLPEDDSTTVSFNTSRGYYKQHCLLGRFKIEQKLDLSKKKIDSNIEEFLSCYFKMDNIVVPPPPSSSSSSSTYPEMKKKLSDVKMTTKQINDVGGLWLYLMKKYDKVFHVLSLYTEEQLMNDDYYNRDIDNNDSLSKIYEHPVYHGDFDSTDTERQEEIIQYIKNIQNNNEKSKLLSVIDDLDEHLEMVRKINEASLERHPNRIYNKKKILSISKVKTEPLNECMSSIQEYNIYGPVLLVHHLQRSIKNDPIVETKQFLIHSSESSFHQIFVAKHRAYFDMREKSNQCLVDTIHKLLFYYYIVYKGNGKDFYIWFVTFFRPEWSNYVKEKYKNEIITNFPSWIEKQRDDMKKNTDTIMRRHRWNIIYDSVRAISLSICFLTLFLFIIIPLINKIF